MNIGNVHRICHHFLSIPDYPYSLSSNSSFLNREYVEFYVYYKITPPPHYIYQIFQYITVDKAYMHIELQCYVIYHIGKTVPNIELSAILYVVLRKVSFAPTAAAAMACSEYNDIIFIQNIC